MYTFVYATDLEAGCENALELCKILVKHHANSKLLIVHAQNPAITDLDITEAAKLKLAVLKTNLKAQQIACDLFLEEGDPVSVVEAACQSVNAVLVIAGASNCGPLAENTIGDTAEELFRELTYPVLLVPPSIKLDAIFKHITFATDYHESDIKMVSQLIAVFAPFHPQVNLLHIYTNNDSPDSEYSKMKDFQHHVSETVNYNNLSFQIMHGDTVLEKIQEHIQLEAAGILVIATHHGRLIDRLFEESLGKELVYDLPVPLMAFHYRKKAKPILL